MPGQVVSSGASFAAGLRSEALATYKRMYKGISDRLSLIMQLDIPSTRRTEDYFFWKSAPHIVRWARGEGMTEKAFAGVRYQCLNHRFARAIPWSHEDLLDDQTKSLLDQARDLGQSVALLDERVAFQIIQAGTDIDLLPVAATAPDGQALYATTDGSVARFGATNGNSLSTGNPTTSVAIQAGYYLCRAQFTLFQDTEGQPLFDQSIWNSPTVVVFQPSQMQFFAQAFRQVLNLGTTTTPANLAGGVSNVLLDSSDVPTLWSSQRVSSANTWYVFATGSPLKAIFSQLREPLIDTIATFENSDLARQTGEESIRFRLRKGYGIHTPYATIKAN